MKFPTEHGIATVRGDQMGSRACYLNSLRKSEPRTVNVILAEVPAEVVNPEDPNQVLRIGKSLSPEAKIEMIRFLKENLDKRRALNPEWYKALKDEVSKLSRSGFIREAIYPRWIFNPVLAKKSSGKWRVCVDFTNLNKACPKDSFPLPRIDQLVDSTAGHELLSFMDAYSGYNQIPMFRPDEEATSFITDRGLYCYKVMPFGLKNAGATYQRLVNMMFAELIGKTMEVYVDDMLVKSLQAAEHVSHIDQTFQILKKYNMKLNPIRCTFGVASARKRFQWTSECQEAFESLKKHLGEAPLLSKPQADESLLLYLAVSDVAVSAVLTREENEPSRKLRPYFQAHSIQVLTNFPLRQVMQKTDASGRLLKWAIELSEFDLTFRPRHAIKGQAFADFMVEFTKTPEMEAIMEPTEPPTWKLFVDGSSGEAGAGAGIVLESPEGHLLNYVIRFGFRASNNAAEYEALLAGLRLAKEMQVRKLLASSDSQLVVNQVNGDFAAKDGNMLAYLKLVLDIIPHFESFELTQVPRLENAHEDALSKLASSMDLELLNIVPIEHLSKPCTFEGEELLWIEGTPLWMQPIIAYLKEQTLPASRGEPAQSLSVVTSPWPFAKWGIDFIGSLPKGRESATFAIVAIDYFTK
ncbi:uncharacterized protein LOC111407412 [Olea europaea var. sylvestris]|uniref:uncharacterized protein LOC111407412 n=1 Tax=Olea europaea var. sylvestris TaxID=158386 RepID=UPI000C1D780E|nr:uncharacterized protein LOC111407412 [Olea europaea var. sylvestris]